MPEQQRLPKEIRFAVVMYGGVSLAIYINGATQELMSMVRATAPNKDDPNGYHVDHVTGVEDVYRRLGKYLGARFAVDILAVRRRAASTPYIWRKLLQTTRTSTSSRTCGSWKVTSNCSSMTVSRLTVWRDSHLLHSGGSRQRGSEYEG